MPAESLARGGDVLFEDHFERQDLGEWKSIIPAFMVRDGVLASTQERSDHGAVGRVYRDMSNVVVDFRFRLTGSRTFNVVFDDKNHKGSHAGHICRVTFAENSIRLGDDKEGVMRNDIFEMRRDANRKADADKLLIGRGSTAKAQLQQNQWYQATIEVVGDQMRVCLDGRPCGYLKSSGIAHPTKTSLHFTVTGPGVEFDDVVIRRAE
ncbi:MAG: hypothetical protein R3C49_11320 [Planctomycetaceae bacterium]